MCDIQQVADHADMIVNGYAFTQKENGIRILNLNRPKSAAFLSLQGEVLETSMDDIEIDIVKDYFQKNKQYLGDQ